MVKYQYHAVSQKLHEYINRTYFLVPHFTKLQATTIRRTDMKLLQATTKPWAPSSGARPETSEQGIPKREAGEAHLL
jgi:hypothetical protein